MIDSSCSCFFMVTFSFHGWSFLLWSFRKRFFVIDNIGYRFFCHFSFCVASVKLLQSLRLFEIFLLKYCSAGVTKLYPILIHCETKPYLYILSKYTLSLCIFELYPILIQYSTIPYLIRYQTIPYLITLPNSTLFSYITEFYPILIH